MPGRAMYRSSVAVLSLISQELGAVRGDPAVSGGEVARQTGERGPGGCGVCQRGLGQKYMDMGTIEVALT